VNFLTREKRVGDGSIWKEGRESGGAVKALVLVLKNRVGGLLVGRKDLRKRKVFGE
jgi:hypothetical protein